jgi:hypothetical protein
MTDKEVHAISFVCIVIAVIAVNAIWMHEAKNTDDSTFTWLGIVDLVAFAGLSYYGANISFTPSGTNINTKQ